MVVDSLSRLSMGSVSHVERNKLAREVYRGHDAGVHLRCNMAYLTPKRSHTIPWHIMKDSRKVQKI